MQIMIDIPEDVLKRTVFYREFKDLNDCITTIKALENAVPVRPGKWIIEDGHVCCSECGEISKEYNYCPFCGADMREER